MFAANQALLRQAGAHLVDFNPESSSKQSKIKKWQQYKNDFALSGVSCLGCQNLLDYGMYLWSVQGVSSAALYVSAAHNFELSQLPCIFVSDQKSVNKVYSRLYDQIQHQSHKAHPLLLPLHLPPISAIGLSILSFMGATGVRPICAENLLPNYEPVFVDGEKKSRVGALKFSTTKDKVQTMNSRTVFYCCCCAFAPHLCVIHYLGLPPVPLSRERLSLALRALDSSYEKNYATRRRHCLSVNRLLTYNLERSMKAWYSKSIKSRINVQLGWVPSSGTFAEYCKDCESFHAAGIDLFGSSTGIMPYHISGAFPT